LFQHIGIPESEHGNRLPSHEFVTAPVACAVRVLTAVYFDHEPLLTTHEISKIGTDRKLPDEFETAQFPVL
jgi:hypothetical protein